MKLQTMFIIAVVALFGALSVVSVRAEPSEGGSDARVGSDRVSDAEITDACPEVADLCRKFLQFCRSNPGSFQQIIDFCMSHDVRCRTLIASCAEHPERCSYLLNCIAHPDRCHERPAARPVRIRDRNIDGRATGRSPADAARPPAGVGD